MSRDEVYGTRSLAYSKWHRYFLDDNDKMIDLDGVDYCHLCFKPLVLIETAMDVGQPNKPTTVLRSLAEKSETLALCVLYTVSDGTNSLTGCECTSRALIPYCDHGISAFRVRRVWPKPDNPWAWKCMTPREFRERLHQIRMIHLQAEHQYFRSEHQLARIAG